ncbi:hypothetical protein [Embleya scabrispora]|uniref:hypothetical protein n=1 Tax=Embleya scabrispora TaxID=159449 RepID=UPI00131A14A1|nr:hypothetical protein [Embleya scabrispora]MYS86016.1 hypothetical protein [Streptomyces sp. SID5474]
MTGTTVPWTRHTAYAPLAQWLLAGLAVIAGAAAQATRRPLRGRGRRVVGGVLVVATPVLAVGMLGLPAYFVTLVAGSGLESATGLAHELLGAALTALLVLVGLAHRRRSAGACARCGLRHSGGYDVALVRPGASTAARRTRRAVYLLMCGLLPWAVTKTVWTLGGDAFGITAEEWRQSDSDGSKVVEALAAVGIDVTVLAAGAGVFLLTGLLYPWGQVFPRWIPVLRGRRVPRLLPLLPAWSTGLGLSVYGVFLTVYAPLAALGVVPAPEPDADLGASRSDTLWLVAFGGLAFGGLGLGLLTAARSYAARTRPVCATANVSA